MRLFGGRKRRPNGAPTYWNSAVVERIQRDGGVDHDTAKAWWGELLVFLDMVAESKRLVSPPKPVDVAWHAFILHTRDYEAYCRERYGRVIHHQPTGAPDPDAYRRAFKHRSSIGTPVDPTIWAVPTGIAAAGDGGGDFGGGDSGGGSSCGGGGCGGGGSG